MCWQSMQRAKNRLAGIAGTPERQMMMMCCILFSPCWETWDGASMKDEIYLGKDKEVALGFDYVVILFVRSWQEMREEHENQIHSDELGLLKGLSWWICDVLHIQSLTVWVFFFSVCLFLACFFFSPSVIMPVWKYIWQMEVFWWLQRVLSHTLAHTKLSRNVANYLLHFMHGDFCCPTDLSGRDHPQQDRYVSSQDKCDHLEQICFSLMCLLPLR